MSQGHSPTTFHCKMSIHILTISFFSFPLTGSWSAGAYMIIENSIWYQKLMLKFTYSSLDNPFYNCYPALGEKKKEIDINQSDSHMFTQKERNTETIK